MSELVRYHGFSGRPPDVAKQLFALPPTVVGGPYFALLLESGGKADVRVFTRAAPGDDHGEVRDWLGEDLGDLPERITRAWWAAGRVEVIKVLDGFGEYTVRTGIACPPSARGAFGHQLRRHETGPEVRAFVIA